MRLQDLAIVTNTPLDTDPVLLEKLKAHDKVQYDPKTDLYSYKVCLSVDHSWISSQRGLARVHVPKQSSPAYRNPTTD